MAGDFIITLLDVDRHDRSAFDCGETELNRYLQMTARQHLQKGIANTYVLVRREEPSKILGYFTLSFLQVDLTELPAQYRNKLPKTSLPAAKLGRLAIDRKCQGNNYGRLLLVDAMRRVAGTIRNAAGVIGLFVDAKNPHVAAFYRKFGFIPLEENPLFLMLPQQTILAAFPERKAAHNSST
ncbi:GNAT family N-acetyltransferase [Geomesophilobacter sediminis]|uniref:GNAT family N-acetyltransferase n=1 Tax=Geomesophilobacter sediminis TaxID=2798584 RepID=A0A8J7M260_9BACT|nr:GNAT family N-acetyltransferase [Geomesophilobacter sediminis]MBJ6727340.1 GNAT family N-acetyltransferase [Geomesophilobacter sediminis]